MGRKEEWDDGMEIELFWKNHGKAERGGLEKKDEKEVLDGAN